ncbi:uncharacterized protein [Rutidosis leptorrhynchoides]|uniref:uncharacterized protein n=1 Tax=Rutidosis leptorrhynchoides TaxID=125765 RepID=UPI003A992243
MHQPKVYTSVDRDHRTVKMLPRSNSVILQDKTTRSIDTGRRNDDVTNSKKITRSNLVDQLREYQIRSKHDWASVSFFSSTSNLPSSRVDVVVFVVWELAILAFFVFSAVSLYFRHLRLGFILAGITLLLLLSMKVTKRIKLAQKKKRRMLLPLSM